MPATQDATKRHDPTPQRAGTPRVGLCSVTLRSHTPQAVIAAASHAGLQSIEWGSDVHVPVGNLSMARSVGDLTRSSGLEIASYGSYFRFPWQRGLPEEAPQIIETAAALGAPRVRVWAGPTASTDASAQDIEDTVQALDRFAELGLERGVETALEFHMGTLTDTAESTLKTLEALRERNVSTYWQPRLGASDEEALADLEKLIGRVSTVHVFSWQPDRERLLLKERSGLWQHAIARTMAEPQVTDLLIEFLPRDDINLLQSESAQIRAWVQAAKE